MSSSPDVCYNTRSMCRVVGLGFRVSGFSVLSDPLRSVTEDCPLTYQIQNLGLQMLGERRRSQDPVDWNVTGQPRLSPPVNLHNYGFRFCSIRELSLYFLCMTSI